MRAPDLTVGLGLKLTAQRQPLKEAIRFGERALNYAELSDRIDRVACLPGIFGLKKGENAAVISRNCIEYIELVAGLPEAGVAVATVNPRLSLREVLATCRDAQVKLVVADAAWAQQLRAVEGGQEWPIVEIGPEYERLLAGEVNAIAARSDISEWDVWTLPYTSGTTGSPKGVAIPHRSRVYTFGGMASIYGCFGPNDRFLALSPMSHGAGLAFALAPLFFGGSIEILDRYEPLLLLDKLMTGDFTGVFMVPTHFQMIFQLDKLTLEKYRRPSIKTIICNAAPLSQLLTEKIIDYFGEGVLFEAYGSTEAGIVTSLSPEDQLRKERCVGLPFPNTDVQIRRADGSECGAGEVGELFSYSPYLFSGYWQQPRETAQAYSDGWVSVGDMARRDDEGYIYIVDRKKDMVISGGVNIYPREIEEVLLTHPDLIDAAVVGVPDEIWGERLRAFVVVKDGIQLDYKEMVEFCQARIASYKIPNEYFGVSELPRNATGKVLKGQLRLEKSGLRLGA